MEDKPITLVVSDLHIGDGKAGDDFVDGRLQFADFVRAQAATPEGRAGQVELIVNGDFLEFAQVCPEAYRSPSSGLWCSEAESLQKLECILAGHPDVFAALKEFQKTGSRVTLFEGNHDIDLHWEGVQARLRELAGPIEFQLGNLWNTRYAGRLRISHGHLFESVDTVNLVKNYSDPRLDAPGGRRLEMCPGTLFMVKFVNLLEKRYPFADNLHPPTILADILKRENRWGLLGVGWLFARFAAAHPKIVLSTSPTEANFAAQLLQAIQLDTVVRDKLVDVYREVLADENMTAEEVKKRLASEEAVAELLQRLIAADVPWEKWLSALDLAKPNTLSLGGSGDTLSLYRTSQIDAESECIKIATGAWSGGAEIVVLGHTHLPQKVEQPDGRYYNPGSWTRYVKAEQLRSLTLEDLEREDRFPYELNCIKVERPEQGLLRSEMICLDAQLPNVQP